MADSADTLTEPEPQVIPPTETSMAQSDTTEVDIPAVKRIRDTDWYLDDGDVVLLVKDRLFKVHKFLFARDSIFFQALFSLPQEKDSSGIGFEGESDTNPIICRGDSIKDFRALCWALYARPPDILAQQNKDTVDIARVIRVLTMSHKYDFLVFQDWAFDVLEALSSVLEPMQFFAKLGSREENLWVLNLASRCKKDVLVKCIEPLWIALIEMRWEGPKKEILKSLNAVNHALRVAEGSNSLRGFHGKVYYAYLRHIGIFDLQARDDFGMSCISETSFDIDQSLSKFSPQRKECIYRGFWSLSQLRHNLSQPPKLDDNPSCSGDHLRDCEPTWRAWWKQVLTQAAQDGRQLNDPGELIKEIQSKLTNPIQRQSRRGSSETIPCNAWIVEQVALMKENFYNSLADRFLGPQ